MRSLLKNGYKAAKRPSGHDISEKFSIDNGAAIPPNLLAIPNTKSDSYYLKYCKDRNIKPHPARYPAQLPEFFIRMLTDKNDMVLDPFAGSCVTGEVCERLERKWLCTDLCVSYLQGALGRFAQHQETSPPEQKQDHVYYRVPRPGILWNGNTGTPLAPDGGQSRQKP